MDDISIVMKVDSAPVDRAVRVMDNLEAELRDVDRAMSKNLITEKQYNAETKRITQSMDRLRVVAKGNAKDFRAFEKTVYGSGKAMRQKEIAMQQAGYQLQDFIVQVQAGTNPLIAFSQQGSQLAGFFAGPWGAAIGLGIAALGGLGTALLGTSGKTDDFATSLDKASDAISEWKDAVDAANEPTKSLEDRFGGLSDYVYRARQQVAEFRKEIAQMRFDNALDKLMSDYVSQRGAGARGQRIAKQFDLGREFMVSLKKETRSAVRREANTIVSQLNFLQTGEGRDDPEMQAYALEEIINAMTRLAMMKDGVNETEAEIIDHFMAQRDLIFQMNELTDDQITKTKERGDLLTQIQTDAMAMEAEIAQEMAQEAKDANTVRARLQSAFTLQRIKDEDKLKQIGIDRMIAMKAMEAAAMEATKQRADAEYGAYQRNIDERHKGEAALFEQAVEISDDLVEKIEEDAKRAARAYENAFNATSFLFANRFADETALMNMPVTIDPNNKPDDKTGKKSDFQVAMEKYRDFLKDLELEESISRELVDVFGSERDIQEELMRLKHEYAILGKEFDEQEVERILRKIEANEEYRRSIEEIKAREQELYDSMSRHFEDAMMSFIDHTKSAEDKFKDFANAVIQDLYRILVVQQTVNAAVAGIKALSGGGSFLSGFFGGFMADGGQVSNNKAYVVGEEGPEVFMPRSQGTIIPNDKLNTGGNVTVVQHLNISTGVQQTVRSEIRQLMPQIAENAKAAVVDSKRRGGNFGKAFA